MSKKLKLKKPKVGFLITGRLKSTRLPKKLLLEIKGKPILSHMIDRIKMSRSIDEIVICTSSEEQDLPLLELSNKNHVKCYRGDPDDVLKRLLDAADHYNLDYILNITADCPFVDPVYADLIYEKFIETNADLIRQLDLPHGAFSYGIKVSALREVNKLKNSSDTEVWGRYFTDTGQFKVIDLDVANSFHKRPGLRMTLDYPEDFEFFKRVFDELYDGRVFTLDQILKLLDDNPEIKAINEGCGKEFKKRFTSQMNISLKKNEKVENALVIGSGSIGQRHIKNLKALGIENIVSLRTKNGYTKELPESLGVEEVFSLSDAISRKPDIAIVSNPTSMHLETANQVLPYIKGVFVEKPLSNSIHGCRDLVESCYKKRVVGFIAHNLLFHPIVKSIKEFFNENDLGRIINIQLQVGQWLPDWHPEEDYRQSYFSRLDLGGGVALTLIHEIYLAIEFLGIPKEVFGYMLDDDSLEVNVDVISDLMIKHENNAISQIHLDYLQKSSHRSGIMSCENGWIAYDFNSPNVTACKLDDSEPETIWSDMTYDSNNMYVEQLETFIDFVEEGRIKHSYDLSKSLDSLNVVEALRESNETGKNIKVKPLLESNYFGT